MRVHGDRLAIMLRGVGGVAERGVAVANAAVHLGVGLNAHLLGEFGLLDDPLIVGGDIDLQLLLGGFEGLGDEEVDGSFLGRLGFFRFENPRELLERGIGAILFEIILRDGDLLIDRRAGAGTDEEIARVDKQRERQNK